MPVNVNCTSYHNNGDCLHQPKNSFMTMNKLPWPVINSAMVSVTLEQDLELEDGGWNSKDTHPDKIVPKGTTVRLKHFQNYGAVILPTNEVYKW